MADTRKQNLTTNDGVNWVGQYQITAGIADMDVEVKGANENNYCVGYYTGSGALTLSNYNNFPTGSIIHDFQAKKTHYKTASSTWVSSAAYT